jgi:hypothetical protein
LLEVPDGLLVGHVALELSDRLVVGEAGDHLVVIGLSAGDALGEAVEAAVVARDESRGRAAFWWLA